MRSIASVSTIENGKPKYELVGDVIRKKILGGDIKNGQQLPSEMDLAKRFGVSRVTLRQALKRLEGEGLLERNHGKGTFACYSPDIHKSGHDSVLNVMFLYIDVTATQGSNLARTINAEQCLTKYGMGMSFSTLTTKDILDSKYPAFLQNGEVDGLLVDGLIFDFHYESIRKFDKPALIIGDHPVNASWPQLRMGAAQMAKETTEILIDRYQLPIVFLSIDTSPNTSYYIQQFEVGYKQAVRNRQNLSYMQFLDPSMGGLAVDRILNSGFKKFGIVALGAFAPSLFAAYEKHGLDPLDNPIALIGDPRCITEEMKKQVYYVSCNHDLISSRGAELIYEMIVHDRKQVDESLRFDIIIGDKIK